VNCLCRPENFSQVRSHTRVLRASQPGGSFRPDPIELRYIGTSRPVDRSFKIPPSGWAIKRRFGPSRNPQAGSNDVANRR